MDTKKIRFVSNRPWLTENSASRPGPIIKTLPDWYRNADWFVPDPKTGKPAEAQDGSGKMPTWKACPAVLDVLGTGYAYKTPCDVEFWEDAGGNIRARVLDELARVARVEDTVVLLLRARRVVTQTLHREAQLGPGAVQIHAGCPVQLATAAAEGERRPGHRPADGMRALAETCGCQPASDGDRKSTRLNSSHRT